MKVIAIDKIMFFFSLIYGFPFARFTFPGKRETWLRFWEFGGVL